MIISDLSNVKRDMIIRACFVRASVSRAANLVSVSKTTVLKFMTAYTNLVKVLSAKHNSGQKSKDRDRGVLKRIVSQDYTVADNNRVESPLSKPCIHDNYSTRVACWEVI